MVPNIDPTAHAFGYFQRFQSELSTIRGLLVVLIFVCAVGSCAMAYVAIQLYSALSELSKLF